MSVASAEKFQVALEDWGVVDILPPPQNNDSLLLATTAIGTGVEAKFIERLVVHVYSSQSQEIPRIEAEPSSAPTWLNDVYSHVFNNEPDDAIDLLFDNVDDLLLAGDFSQCNDLLLVIDPKQLDTNLLVAALSITKAAADRLPARRQFVQRVERRLKQLAPDRLDGLLSGLL